MVARFAVWIACMAAGLPAYADMPARKVLEAWLDAFNGADPAKTAAFDAAHSPSRPAANNPGLRFRTGGFTLVRIDQETPTSVTALVQEKTSDAVATATLSVADDQQGRITELGLRLVPRPGDLAIARVPIERALALTSQRVDALAANDQFSGVVLVAKGESTLLERAVGQADRAGGQPVSVDTRFRIGSMNKMFTSVAILQLVEAGKVKLDDPVGKHLTSYPQKDVAEKVTIRHLLTHTGGTGDIFTPEYASRRMQVRALEDYLELFGTRALTHEPGATFRYSNYGYILLGLIVEKASGMPYYDYVREKIFKVAGMTATDSLPETEPVAARSMGYMRRDGEWKPNTDTLPFRGTSAGGGYSTARDLVSFARALESGKLVSRELLAEASKGQVESYGFGFGVAGNATLRRYGHGGGAPGMNGDLRIYPASGYIVVVLSNLDPPAATRVADFFDNRMPRD